MSDTDVNEIPNHFIQHIIDEDVKAQKYPKVITRFPPEPNGYLHIGHAKSICLNFTMAEQYQGHCNLRFDDTNPEKESQEYIDAIKKDISWLGFTWEAPIHYASDYFATLYSLACSLIKKGLAYVDTQSGADIRANRGNLKEAGKDSPFRERSIEENLELFNKMKAGEFAEGEAVLRAKIDMASPNMNMRDPIIYRVRHVKHHQTGNDWCIYPMYDFTHPISDALEHVSHSLCTLEFEDHRPFYDWLLDNLLDAPEFGSQRPHQFEFSRLELNYSVTSKRKLKQLVDQNAVTGWNDPRMPTIAGMRRRGYTPQSLRKFCQMIGVTKSQGVVDVSMLEHAIRDDLNTNAPRRMCVLNPLKLVIENYEEGKTEIVQAKNHPQNEALGTRDYIMSREVYIDKDDFREEANKKYKRLVLGKEVRLRNGYVIKAERVQKDDKGEISTVYCKYDPDTLGKNPEDRRIKGVIHWVSAVDAIDCEVRLYDRLFNHEAPASIDNFLEHLNPESLVVLKGCKAEKSLADASAEAGYQFEREGYFCRDSEESDILVFNRTISLRDTWQN